MYFTLRTYMDKRNGTQTKKVKNKKLILMFLSRLVLRGNLAPGSTPACAKKGSNDRVIVCLANVKIILK